MSDQLTKDEVSQRAVNFAQADQVRLIGEVTGRAVRWEELPPEEARRQLLAAWDDPGFVNSALATWAGLVTRPEPVSLTVEEITGSPARTFRQWAADHASDFRPLSVAEVADRVGRASGCVRLPARAISRGRGKRVR